MFWSIKSPRSDTKETSVLTKIRVGSGVPIWQEENSRLYHMSRGKSETETGALNVCSPVVLTSWMVSLGPHFGYLQVLCPFILLGIGLINQFQLKIAILTIDKNLIKPQNQILMVEMQVLASNVRDTSFSFVKPPLRLITFVFFTKLSLASYIHAWLGACLAPWFWQHQICPIWLGNK